MIARTLFTLAHIVDPDNSWIEEMEAEADYVPPGWRRTRFAFGGLSLAVRTRLLRDLGVRRIGQCLIALGLIAFSLVALTVVTARQPEGAAAIFSLIALYGLMGALAVLHLGWLRTAALLGLGLFLTGWAVLPFLVSTGFAPTDLEFLRALSFEAAGIMAGIWIAGTYVEWSDSTA